MEGDEVPGSVGSRAKSFREPASPEGSRRPGRARRQAEMWRSTAGCVQGEVRLTAAPGTSRRPSPPRGFSLCLCPFLLRSAACLTLAHPAAGGGCLDAPLPRGFPDARQLPCAADGRTAGRLARSSRSCVLVVRSALSGPLAGCREQAFLAGGSCLCVEAPFFQSSASSPRQACPGSPLPSSSPLAQQGQPHPQPPWLPLGLPQPIPTCSLFQTLAQPHPHLTGPTWVPQPQLEPIGNRGPSPQPHSTSPPPLEPTPGT